MFWFTPITRSPAQGPACKGHGRNGQKPAITPKAAYTTVPKRAGSRKHNIFEIPQYNLKNLEIF
ncbi:hypothetical protein, partial [Lacticaseibacillus rhamnosus]|uniref:hypothetical protein n=1 Tax=Lacticaseibacillus rhamnosus TaxID=47715 RepID=UPI001CDBE792